MTAMRWTAAAVLLLALAGCGLDIGQPGGSDEHGLPEPDRTLSPHDLELQLAARLVDEPDIFTRIRCSEAVEIREGETAECTSLVMLSEWEEYERRPVTLRLMFTDDAGSYRVEWTEPQP